jgi:hypothetical protein
VAGPVEREQREGGVVGRTLPTCVTGQQASATPQATHTHTVSPSDSINVPSNGDGFGFNGPSSSGSFSPTLYRVMVLVGGTRRGNESSQFLLTVFPTSLAPSQGRCNCPERRPSR